MLDVKAADKLKKISQNMDFKRDHALNSGKTRDLTLAAIARNIFMETAQVDISLQTVHIMGNINEIADSLSRWNIGSQYQQKFYHLLPIHIWAKIPKNAFEINWSV